MSAVWLVGGQVVDGTGRDPYEADLCLEDGRVSAIGAAPAAAEGLDVQGCTITPGLIDAHVHLGVASPMLDLFGHRLSVAEIAADMFANTAQTLDAGFTTVRDVGGIDRGLSAAIAAGKVRGPRVLQCGPIQCQTGGHGHLGAEWEPTRLWETHHVTGLMGLSLLSDGPDSMRANVRETFRRGADFIKLCVTGGVVSTHDAITDTQLTTEEIAVAVQEATARGTYVTVRAHNNDGIRNAVRAGARCVEHGSAVDEETAALMASAGVAHVPTLAVVEALLRDAAASGLPPEIASRAALVRDSQKEAVLVSRAAGVRVGLGSDLIGPDQTGRAEELVLRAQIESPMAALVAATRTNAEVLRIADDIGTLEVGKAADLVVWRTSPVEDATVFTQREQALLVLKAGKVVRDAR